MTEYKEVNEAVAGLMTAFEDFKFNQTARVDALETRLNRPGAASVHRAGVGDLGRERTGLGKFIRLGDDGEMKSMSVGEDAQGGYSTLPAVSSAMTKRLWDSSPIRRLARIQVMTTGDAWAEPIDRGESGAEWVVERAERPALTTPQLGFLTIPLCEIYASQPVTQKLLDLSFADVGAWIEAKISDKFARTECEAFLTGDGIAKPDGILSYPINSTADATRPANELQFIPSGASTTITVDGLRDCYWGLRAPYRSNATWLMSSATASVLDKLKDGSRQYLWRPATSASEPATLLGRPVEIDEGLPAISAGTYPVLFGDFQRAYIIVERSGLKMLRDPYTSKPNVVFYAYRRVGGGLGDCDALKVLKIGT